MITLIYDVDFWWVHEFKTKVSTHLNWLLARVRPVWGSCSQEFRGALSSHRTIALLNIGSSIGLCEKDLSQKCFWKLKTPFSSSSIYQIIISFAIWLNLSFPALEPASCFGERYLCTFCTVLNLRFWNGTGVAHTFLWTDRSLP